MSISSFSRRRRALLLTLGLTVAASGVGWVAGQRVLSSREARQLTASPAPSVISVSVERTVIISELVLRGDLRSEGAVSVGGEGLLGKMTTGAALRPGTQVTEGAVVAEIEGRPVFVLMGVVPMYRDLASGDHGKDVAQIEEALARIGYDIGTLDGVFDTDLGVALDAWYSDAGFAVEVGPPAVQLALSEAVGNLTRVRAQYAIELQKLELALEPVTSDAVAILQFDIQRAELALKSAHQSLEVESDIDAQHERHLEDVLEEKAAQLSEARSLRKESGGETVYLVAQGNYAVAEIELEVFRAQQREGRARIADWIRALKEDVRAANAHLRAVVEPSYSVFRRAISVAASDVKAAEERVDVIRAGGLPIIRMDELTFVEDLPRYVQDAGTSRGVRLTGPAVMLAGEGVVVDTSVGFSDVPALSVGDIVTVELDARGVELSGSIVSVSAAAGTDGAPAGRHYVRIRLDDFPLDLDPVGNIRIIISLSSSDGEVLAVPLAALNATLNGDTVVYVVSAIGTLRVVIVETGLRARGSDLVEVIALDGGLAEGDLVVVSDVTGQQIEPSRDPVS